MWAIVHNKHMAGPPMVKGHRLTREKFCVVRFATY